MFDTMLHIISGAQTGIDRGALDAALRCDVPCGGWVPRGRKAEDGVIPDHYPVQELESADYRKRTKMNVRDSDGTVIIYFCSPRGGTELTLRYCLAENKPYLLIDADELAPDRAAYRIQSFLRALDGGTINFAGPRESGQPGAHDYAMNTVMKFIELYRDGI